MRAKCPLVSSFVVSSVPIFSSVKILYLRCYSMAHPQVTLRAHYGIECAYSTRTYPNRTYANSRDLNDMLSCFASNAAGNSGVGDGRAKGSAPKNWPD